jgi:DNA-directed RNA polymerase subunit M/transcription elongation factor TFIIS
MNCPQCGELRGEPYDARLRGHTVPVMVYVQCDACHHQWVVETPSPILRTHK